MRTQKIYKIDKSEIKATKKVCERIKRFYASYFSQKRANALRILSGISQFLIPFVVGLIVATILFPVAIVVDKAMPGSSADAYQSAAFYVCAILFGVVATIVLTLLFTLSSSEEYFRAKDLGRFFEIAPIAPLSNLDLIAQTIVFLIAAFICSFVEPKASFAFCSVSFVFAIYLLVRYLEFKCKHRYENYLYYLKNTGKLRKIRKYQIMFDYISFMNAIYSYNHDDTDALTKRLKIYKRYTLRSLDVMEKMMQDEESVVNEQVIIEKYFLYFSKVIDTPAQFIALIDMLDAYLRALNKCKSKRNIKTTSGSKENIYKCLLNSLESPIIKFLEFDLELDKLPGSAVTERLSSKSIVVEANEIILVQAALVIAIRHNLEEMISLNNIGFSQAQINTIKSKIDTYDAKQKNNAICLKNAMNRMSDFFDDILNQIENIE